MKERNEKMCSLSDERKTREFIFFQRSGNSKNESDCDRRGLVARIIKNFSKPTERKVNVRDDATGRKERICWKSESNNGRRRREETMEEKEEGRELRVEN